jgi:hypothetical protein
MVTSTVGELSRVPGLEVEDWLADDGASGAR